MNAYNWPRSAARSCSSTPIEDSRKQDTGPVQILGISSCQSKRDEELQDLVQEFSDSSKPALPLRQAKRGRKGLEGYSHTKGSQWSHDGLHKMAQCQTRTICPKLELTRGVRLPLGAIAKVLIREELDVEIDATGSKWRGFDASVVFS